MSENIIRSVWTSQLPRNVQSFLAGQTESNLEAAALCADRVAALSAGQDRLHDRFKELDSNSRGQGPRSKDSHPAFKSRRPVSKSPSRGDTTSTKCWYHHCFGARAKNCIPPCSYRQQGN